jgi:archaellum component FlaC/DnaJ-domain-containing protein 1
MPGIYQYDVEIKSNVAKLLSDMKQVQDRLDTVEGKEYKIKLNVDEKKLSSVISNLEKMLDSLGKGTGDFKQFENLSKELSSVVSEVQSLSKAFGKVDDSGTKTLPSSIQNIDKSLSELSQNILNVNKNMGNMGDNTSGAVRQVENITNESKKAASALENVAKTQAKVNGQKPNISSGSTESVTNSIKEENNVLEQNTQKVKENTQAKKQNANANLNKYDKRLDSYNGKIDKYQATIDRFNDGGWTSDTYLKNVQAVRDAVKQYATLLDNIKTNQNGIATDEDIQNLDEYEKKIKDTIATVTNMSASEKGYSRLAGQKEIDKINKILRENSAMSSEAKAKIKAYKQELISGNPSVSLEKIHGEILKIVNAEELAGRTGRSFFDTLKNSGFHQLAAQMAGMFGFYDVINVIKQAASTVTELNTQITELAKVSEQSSKQIYADFDSYADIAKEVRGTISDTIAATADWSKNGYSIPDAKQLAEISQLYKNVGDGIDIDAANESLISTLKGFQLEADQAKHIVDVFNEVSNNEAISSGGIGAASFNAASTSLEKSVSLVTATNSVLQNPEKVGKQILAYLYSNVMKIKVAISVKILRRTRPRKDYNVCFNY